MSLTKQHKFSLGFTLLEVLIAVFILSIGLLGLARLQLTGLQHNESAYLRTQASILASDMFDQMRANQIDAQNGRYLLGMVDDVPVAPASVAEFDLTDWMSNIIALLPAGDGEISCADSNVADGFSCSTGSVYTVTVSWREVQDDGDRGRTDFSYSGAL
ncbi:MAG: type IV pilus modification protein PilV [Gammaproteobacteria bacterium]|nr:type IV pilus modification protein PilV [Gammaproteobacteria bacterium]